MPHVTTSDSGKFNSALDDSTEILLFRNGDEISSQRPRDSSWGQTLCVCVPLASYTGKSQKSVFSWFWGWKKELSSHVIISGKHMYNKLKIKISVKKQFKNE